MKCSALKWLVNGLIIFAKIDYPLKFKKSPLPIAIGMGAFFVFANGLNAFARIRKFWFFDNFTIWKG